MSDTTFYAKARQGSVRKITLRAAVLISPKNNKRIRIPMTMGLSNQKKAGTPEWIAAAHEFVAKNHDTVTPKVHFRGFDISLATENQNLFDKGTLSCTKCDLKNFVIREAGTGDDKDVVMDFTAIAPFSTRLWEFAGQMAGDEIQANFVQGEMPEEDQGDLELEEDEEEADEEEESADEDE